MISKFFCGVILIFIFSCSPKLLITNNFKNGSLPNEKKCNYIFGKNAILSDSSIIVADFETKGNFFTPMKFRVNKSIDLIKKGISDLNYNALRIEEIKFPGPFRSKSYDIKGQILMVNSYPVIKARIVNQINDINGKYIKLYRPNHWFGSGISFPIFLNEQFLCGLDNNNKMIIEVFNSETNINLQIESYGGRYIIPIDFKTNKTIYINCEVDGIGRPKTTFEDSSSGDKNFDKVKIML